MRGFNHALGDWREISHHLELAKGPAVGAQTPSTNSSSCGKWARIIAVGLLYLVVGIFYRDHWVVTCCRENPGTKERLTACGVQVRTALCGFGIARQKGRDKWYQSTKIKVSFSLKWLTWVIKTKQAQLLLLWMNLRQRERKGQAKSREPSRARDEVGDMETRLAKIELPWSMRS
ncbi:hypothetical protein GH714_023021 [Hevea brasiliensis]|uniref:Uncharacterized protein n=1 Tax=Hevea brasiliensis TaxID=3981 RepID=A0A6A6M8P8_HEVBR|nr:hypothetical protein GH714_023021 [Hevea brasiliensis]